MAATAPKINWTTWEDPKNILFAGNMVSYFFLFFLFYPGSSENIFRGAWKPELALNTSSLTKIPDITLWGFWKNSTIPLPRVA